MITSLFLQASEVLDMTGLQQPFAQKRWLDHHHWIYAVDIKGRPKISRIFFEEKMSGKSGDIASANPLRPKDYSVNVMAMRK